MERRDHDPLAKTKGTETFLDLYERVWYILKLETQFSVVEDPDLIVERDPRTVAKTKRMK